MICVRWLVCNSIAEASSGRKLNTSQFASFFLFSTESLFSILVSLFTSSCPHSTTQGLLRMKQSAVGIVLLLCVAAATATNIMLVSDIHLSPFYGTIRGDHFCATPEAPPMGTPFCDTPPALLQSLGSAILETATQNNARLLINPGDWVTTSGEKWPDYATMMPQTVDAVAKVLVRASGSTNAMGFHPNIFWCLGNHDFVPRYYIDVNDTKQELLHSYSAVFQRNGLLTPEEARTFERCGFFARHNAVGNLTLISLNSIIYDLQHVPKSTDDADPCGQFAWLRGQLVEARRNRETVYIVTHIPPSIVNWVENYYTRYHNIVASFSDVIALHIYGHMHLVYHVAMDDGLSAPGLSVGGVTRLTGQNPNYMLLEVDSAWRMVDVRQHYITDESTWVAGNSLKTALRLPALSTSQLYNASWRLRTDAPYFSPFYTMFVGGIVRLNATGIVQKGIACNTYAFTTLDVAQCLLS